MEKTSRRRQLIWIWVSFFVVTCAIAWFVQLVALPVLFPSLHAGDGLLVGTDSIHLHQVASQMAAQIREQGWSAWKYRVPTSAVPDGIAGAIYALTISKPWVLVPINALVHSASAFLIVLIALPMLGSISSAVVAGLPFLIFPSAVSWYAQINRDGYAFLGFLLYLHAIVRFARAMRAPEGNPTADWKWIALWFFEVFGAAFCVWSGRAHFLSLLLIVALIQTMSVVLKALFARSFLGRRHDRRWIVALIIGAGVPVLFMPFLAHSPYRPGDARMQLEAKETVPDDWRWSSFLPRGLEQRFREIGLRRDAYRGYPPTISFIDREVTFKSADEEFRYVPRALEIALLAPFPTDWSKPGNSPGGGAMRKLAALEMLVTYAALLALLLRLRALRRGSEFVAVLFACAVHLLVLGLSVSVLGALHRYRYGYLMVLVGLGAGLAYGEIDRLRRRASWA